MPAYEAMQNAIIDGNADIALALTNAALAEGAGAREILDTGLLPGMDEVGRRMKAGDCFIPEVLLSARTMQSCLNILKPHLAAGESSSLGTIVIGTVEGDVHDIGKNLVGMLLEGAGFEVHNLGTGITAADFIKAGAGARCRHHRHERAAHDHDAAHEGHDRRAGGCRPARQGQGHRRRRADHGAVHRRDRRRRHGANAVLAVDKAKELISAGA